ncbi:MAG: hypothetical protein WEC14_04220 [Chloroflexota bacterium]
MSSDSPIVLAMGWATVDTDRAVVEMAHLLRPGSDFRIAAPCQHLGARCWIGVARDDTPDGVGLIVILEPSTEGRLAATLARHGEGWCATWEVAGAARDDPTARASVRRDGPLGLERLVPGPTAGPHRLVVESDTIGP